MACPFFKPETLVGPDGRLPLGDQYRGSCQANPAEPFYPKDSHQREMCNLGYARGRCDRFRGDVDAVRFSISDGRLIWVMERDYAPADHGVLELEQPARNDVLTAQARAFIESYRRCLSLAQSAIAG